MEETKEEAAKRRRETLIQSLFTRGMDYGQMSRTYGQEVAEEVMKRHAESEVMAVVSAVLTIGKMPATMVEAAMGPKVGRALFDSYRLVMDAMKIEKEESHAVFYAND